MIIVDDFLENAEGYREAALSLDYPDDQKNEGYPGRNSSKRILPEGLDQEISRLVGEPLRARKDYGHGRTRITLAQDKGRADIHIDPCYWSAILYLSLPEHGESGTHFYRHKETGTDRWLYEASDLQKLGARNQEEAKIRFNEILLQDGHDRSKWEETMHVPMKFNRLLILRPWLWHTAGPGFGSSLQDGRLIQVLFFDRA
nr:DUF6445 family protein [Parvularcula maris]